MTIGSENLGNGSGKSERFGGKYRGARRDTVLTEVTASEADLSARDTSGPALELAEPPVALSLSSLEPEPLDESAFSPTSWTGHHEQPLVDHPLLRGLLMELPPKGSQPSQEWLDRWFEATRSILELLYAQAPVHR